MDLLQQFNVYLIQFSILLWTCGALLIPKPTGPYTVAMTTATLLDSERINPYDPQHGNRNVTISLFYPIHRKECAHTCTVPYMPPATAAYADSLVAGFGVSGSKIFESFQLQFCCEPSHRAVQDAAKFPLVLFSAGLGGSRLLYSVMAQELASEGYIVVTIDSTYGSVIVEYPDGTYTNGLNISYWCTEDPPGFCKPTANIPPLLETNVKDAQFVLATLSSNTSASSSIPGVMRSLKVNHAAYIGHSFGGATAIRASMRDTRFVGAVNLDGGQFGNITDSHAAAVLFGRSDPVPHNKTDDATWRETWDHLRGWRRELGLKDAQHTTFDDIPLLSKLDGWPVTKKLQSYTGTLDGQRSFDVVLTYLKAFLEFSLRNKDSELFAGPSNAYPEVVVDRET